MAAARCLRRANRNTARRILSPLVARWAGVRSRASAQHGGAQTFQEAVQQLQEYWAGRGAVIAPPHNVEVGAGTMNPSTFLRVLGPEPWRACYVEPAIRPADSRYGENPNRTQRHTQVQVILQPEPERPQEEFLESLSALGVDFRKHDIRFVEDDWESPVLGAWGLGWEVWLDGLEITQFTYFQQAGGYPCDPPAVEITYGLERILMALQGKSHFRDIAHSPEGTTMGDLFSEVELEFSRFNLDYADVHNQRERFRLYEDEGWRIAEKGLALPAYDQLLKASHAFNILDARGAVSVTERADLFARMRSLARKCASLWLHRREELGFPLGRTPSLSPPEPPLPPAPSSGYPRDFVLEIGTEELPAGDVSSGPEQLRERMASLLSSLSLDSGEVVAGGTPRRLWCIVHAVPHRQPDSVERLRGPPEHKAFDECGKPTKALEGFCRKQGALDPEQDVEVLEDAKGVRYCYATVRREGKSAIEALSEGLPSVIDGLSFRKTMRWRGDASFSRPVRWILALLGDDLVPFSALNGVPSQRATWLLRSSLDPFPELSRAEEYESVTSSDGIVLKQEERRRVILEEGSRLAGTIGGELSPSAVEEVGDEVANLVELPLTLLGSFGEGFLSLPREVLEVVMTHHQRYFPVRKQGGEELVPYFVFTANGKPDEGVCKAGHEAVLRARFEDATFFYRQDTEGKTLEDNFRPLLAGITFEKSLGSMLDKVQRCESLVSHLAPLIGSGASEETVRIAEQGARLHRSDMATNLVQEFTELQGTMGRHYALKQGVDERVADTLLEAHKPRHASDSPPSSMSGAIVSVCDRLDSLVGLFGAVGAPSSTADPYSLRRIAYGLVETILSHGLTFNLRQAIDVAAERLPEGVTVDEGVRKECLAFTVRRLEQKLMEEGVRTECIRAILPMRGEKLSLAADSARELEGVLERGEVGKAMEAFARPTRLVRSKPQDVMEHVDEGLFAEQAERDLFQACERVRASVEEGMGLREFLSLAERELHEPVGRLFDEVFVMAGDERVRRNRVTLLSRVASLPAGIVELDQLPGF